MQIGWNLDEKILLDVPIDPNEFKILLFTSGTTGPNKVVEICQRNMIANIINCIESIKAVDPNTSMSILPTAAFPAYSSVT